MKSLQQVYDSFPCSGCFLMVEIILSPAMGLGVSISAALPKC